MPVLPAEATSTTSVATVPTFEFPASEYAFVLHAPDCPIAKHGVASPLEIFDAIVGKINSVHDSVTHARIHMLLFTNLGVVY